MIPSHKFTSRFVAVAAPFALLTCTAFFPTGPANASEPQPLERATTVATVTAATPGATDTVAQPVDPPRHQGESILEAVRQNLERLISSHKNLEAHASSLAADLESEKSRVKELLSERDQALLKVTESAASIARLEARWSAAQDALIAERKRHKAVQQQQEQALNSLRSELSAVREKRDALKAQLDELIGKSKRAPEGQAEAAPKAAQTRPIIPEAPSEPLQLGHASQQRLASLDQTQRAQPGDQEAEQELKNAIEEKIGSFLSQHRPTLQKAQDILRSVDPDITQVRSRLINARATIDGVTIPPNSVQDAGQNIGVAVEQLAARIGERTKETSKKHAGLNGLSLETEAISKTFESTQEQMGQVEDQQDRVKSEASAFKQTEEQFNKRFDDVRKRTLELETAAELLRIRQVLSDFKMGQIGRAALAQHESALQAIATNLDVLAGDFAKTNEARDRLLILGDSLRGQVALIDANRSQLTEAVTSLDTRLDAWLERAGSAHLPPLNDLVAMLQEIKQGVGQHAAAGSGLRALTERLNATLKATGTDVRAVSIVLRDRQKLLREQIERLRHLEAYGSGSLPHTGVAARDPRQQSASCPPVANEQEGAETSIIGTQGGACQEIDRFLRAVGHVREALAARVTQLATLSETADGLTNDLLNRENAIVQIGRDVAKASRTNQEQFGRVKRLGDSIASLSEQQNAHEQQLSKQTKTIARLQEQLASLTKRLTKAATNAQTYAPNPTGASTAGDAQAKEIASRLGDISERVEILKAAIVALKRPPPPPTRALTRPTARGPETDSDQPRVAESDTTNEIGVECNPALPSCRRWLYLREQRTHSINGAADDRSAQPPLNRR